MNGDKSRVLVVDDDPDIGLLLATLLRRSGLEAMVASDAREALDRMRAMKPDLVLTDIEMPGMNGLELVTEIRRLMPQVPIVVMTAHASVDYAISALRAQADEFLTKPLDNAQVIDIASRLLAEGRNNSSAPRETVLAIGAHPDDVEIGIGGTLAAHQVAGDAISILTLSRGGRGGETELRQHESLASAELLGARLFLQDLVDTEISEGGSTVRLIEDVVSEVQPTIVYTHTAHDRHQDHRAVHRASLVATRLTPSVVCYQSPSTNIEFRPSRFVRIERYMERKLELLACFGSQTSQARRYLDPEVVRATALYWARFGGGSAVEPLEIIRETAEFVRAVEYQGAEQS